MPPAVSIAALIAPASGAPPRAAATPGEATLFSTFLTTPQSGGPADATLSTRSAQPDALSFQAMFTSALPLAATSEVAVTPAFVGAAAGSVPTPGSLMLSALASDEGRAGPTGGLVPALVPAGPATASNPAGSGAAGGLPGPELPEAPAPPPVSTVAPATGQLTPVAAQELASEPAPEPSRGLAGPTPDRTAEEMVGPRIAGRPAKLDPASQPPARATVERTGPRLAARAAGQPAAPSTPALTMAPALSAGDVVASTAPSGPPGLQAGPEPKSADEAFDSRPAARVRKAPLDGEEAAMATPPALATDVIAPTTPNITSPIGPTPSWPTSAAAQADPAEPAPVLDPAGSAPTGQAASRSAVRSAPSRIDGELETIAPGQNSSPAWPLAASEPQAVDARPWPAQAGTAQAVAQASAAPDRGAFPFSTPRAEASAANATAASSPVAALAAADQILPASQAAPPDRFNTVPTRGVSAGRGMGRNLGLQTQLASAGPSASTPGAVPASAASVPPIAGTATVAAGVSPVTADPDQAPDDLDSAAPPAGSEDVTAPMTGAAAPAREAAAGAPAQAESRATPATVQSLAAELVRRLDQRVSRFEVALNPAGLGRVDVALQIGAQGRLTAALSFDSPQSAAELKARAPELESALRDAGFDIASGDIRFTQTGAGLSGESGGRAARDFADDQTSARATAPGARAFGAAADLSDPPPLRSRRAVSGLDIQV